MSSPSQQSYQSFDDPSSRKKKKVPKRILHFSDGVLEEYSTDEEEREEARRQEAEADQSQAVVTSEMSWAPWFIYLAWVSATSALRAADSLGEKLAWWLGITSPKYYYEIQEAKRMLKEEEERKKNMDAEMAGWVGDGKEGIVESQEAVRSKELGLEES